MPVADTTQKRWPFLLHSLIGVTLIGVLFALFSFTQKPDPTFDVGVSRPAYSEIHPRVLFDEAHNNFHTSEGRYKPFADILTNDGYEIVPGRKRFDATGLQGFQVLIIANAIGNNEQGDGPAFTEDECRTVRDWVKDGGSLLLITDIYPMSAPSQPLAKEFGVEMSAGKTEDSAHSDPEGAPSQLVFARDNGLLADHAITEGRDPSERIRRVVTFSGQSLKGPAESSAFLPLADSAVDLSPKLTEVEGMDGFPGRSVTYTDPVSAAGRSQGIAIEYGRGRVVVLGEAGMLSAQIITDKKKNFGMNVKGNDNKQLSLNIMHWLTRLL